MKDLNQIRSKSAFIIDMDGVIYHGNHILNGAVEFVEWLEKNNK
jgi:NagD protein